ncbi:mucin-2-like [Rhinichthys klamathensis goyatoka]|uniref:mucin-2-like n=1 Tax=Rhinichthys klamathensis goyatoka TaxID=3034132 RepID=UPI0024B60AA2|nr:mucin-2-like [Rhinichthys klamathensis goyatoka]
MSFLRSARTLSWSEKLTARNMGTLFLLLFTLERFSALSGFLIAHTTKGLCLSAHVSVVVLRMCDESDPSQQWIWTGDRRLNHTLLSRCLWSDQSAAVPHHARLVKLSDCHTAPAWTCYDSPGVFGLAETRLFLKKQGMRVVVRSKQSYSNWSMMTVNSEGRRVTASLCPDTGPSTVSTVISTGEITTRTVPLMTQHTVRSRTKRTATTGLGDLTAFTAETDLKENFTQMLETESPYEKRTTTTGLGDLTALTAETDLKENFTQMLETESPYEDTDVSSTALMETRTLHVPQNFTQNRLHVSSDVLEQTHNPPFSQEGFTLSTTDTEPLVSSDASTEAQTALDSHTGPSEGNSIRTEADRASTESSPVSNTDGAWTNATTRRSKITKDVQTMLPFKTRTTRAITEVLTSTDTRSAPDTDTSSARARASATTSPTAPHTSTPALDTDTFISVTAATGTAVEMGRSPTVIISTAAPSTKASSPPASTVTPSVSTVTHTASTVTASVSTVTPTASRLTPITSTVTPTASRLTPITSTVPPTTSTLTPTTSTFTPPASTVTPTASTVTPPVSTVTPTASTLTPPVSTVTPPASTLTHTVSTVTPTASTLTPPASTLTPTVSTVTPTASTLTPTASTVTPTAAATSTHRGHLWQNRTGIKDMYRLFLLDAPISPFTLFGDSVNTVVSRFREVKKHEEAFVQFLPRHTQGEGLPATQLCPGPSKCKAQKQSVASRAPFVKTGDQLITFSSLQKGKTSGPLSPKRKSPDGLAPSPVGVAPFGTGRINLPASSRYPLKPSKPLYYPRHV